MGLIKKIGSFLINFSIFFLIVTFSPGLPPKTTFPFEEFSFVKPQSLLGVLEPNKLLENPEKLFVGKLPGPEHLLSRNGAIYTALHNGDVVKIVGEEISKLGKFGKLCFDEKNSEFVCGRPLGLAFDTVGDNLIVMDTSNGIFELNLASLERKELVSVDAMMGGSVPRAAKLFNSVAVAKNGDLYFTDSSSDYNINKIFLAFLANPSGRLIHYSRKTGKLTVLLDNLWFANGVVLSPDEDFIVVSDLGRSKLVKFWLKEGKFGETENFVEGLPGLPDNLTPDKNGIWVALPLAADPSNPIINQSMSTFPLLRKFIARLLSLSELFFTFIDSLYPQHLFKAIVYKIGSLTPTESRATILRIDWNGKIIAAYHSFDFAVYTHVMELDGHLYLGSISHDYIAKVVRHAHL